MLSAWRNKIFGACLSHLSPVFLKRMLTSLTVSEPGAPIPGKYPVWSSSANEIFSDLENGSKVFIQDLSSSPTMLINMLYKHVIEADLKGITLFHLHPMGDLPYLNPEAMGHFRLSTPYASKFCRDAINEGRADFIPIGVSEIPIFYSSKHLNLNYALIMVSPPDKHGFCSLGAAIGTTRSAIQNSAKIIGQVNPKSPITYGDASIHVSKIDYLIHAPQELCETPLASASITEQKIARIIADNLVDDGATIQLGFGRIPAELTGHLRGHKDLGVHSELISDGIIDLVNLGVITNRMKAVQQGRIVASYALGTKRIFDFINENPLVALYGIGWTTSPEVISRNPKVTTINTCFEMDLTGQSAADGIGEQIYTGVGGQLDFTRAASLSADGKGRPVITMCSVNSSGESNIVPILRRGSSVVATRAHLHYVVTEYGIAYLFGKSLRQRAHALIKIAHPKFRESLEKASFDSLRTMPSP